VVAILRHGKLLLVERLDQLKGEIHELTVTLAEGVAQPPEVPGEILRQCRRRAAVATARATRANRPPWPRCRRTNPVKEVAIRTPNLEEIFAAYMQISAGEAEEED